MNLIEQFKVHAYDDKKNLLAFFHGLKKKEQQTLKKTIIAINKDFCKWHDVRHDNLAMCAMYIFASQTFHEHFTVPERYFSDKYYRIYRPSWLVPAILNTYVGTMVDFKVMTELSTYPDCDITAEMIAQRLCDFIHEYDNKSQTRIYRTERFAELGDFFWCLFAGSSTPAWIDETTNGAFTQTIIEYVSAGKIERQKLLDECLLTASRPLNKRTISWSFELFSTLAPTDLELTARQPQLILALNCPHSKPQSQALAHLKYLAKIGTLNADDFVVASLSPLASTTKSVVTNTLAVFEQIAKTTPDRHAVLCENVLTALLFRDEKVQTRVAKFLLTYGDMNNEALTAVLSEYLSDTFSTVQTMLAPFAGVEAPVSPSKNIESAKKIRADNQITLPTDFDDQCFYLTQAFQSNTPWQFDGYLCVVREVFAKIDDTNLERIESIWEQANVVAPNGNGRYAEILMQKHFIACARVLFPCLHDKPAPLLTEDWSDLTEQSIQIFQARLDHCQRLLQDKQDLPMLSTPTHSPCFIVFSTFIERLNAYANQLNWIDLTDFQIALSRLVIDAHACTDGLSGELAKLMRYIVKGEINYAHCQTHALWLSAIHYRGDTQALVDYGQQFEITVDNWLPTLAWRQKDAIFTLDWWQRQKDRDDDGDGDDDLGGSEATQQKTRLQPFQQHFLDDVLEVGQFDFIPIFETSDFTKLFYATPHDPTALCVMAVLTQSGLSDTINIMESSALLALNAFLDIWDKDFSEVVYLFYTCQMLSAKKPVAQLAGELWLQKVSENNMDSEQLGRVLGKLEHNEYAPLKRFTDLISAQLMNVSTHHKQALITLITAMIAEMHDAPIKGVKKLLELYFELLTVTETPLPTMAEEKLATWAEVKSLQPIVKKLMTQKEK